MMTKNDTMTELKLTRTLRVLLRQLELSFENDEKHFFSPTLIDRKQLQFRAQIYVD